MFSNVHIVLIEINIVLLFYFWWGGGGCFIFYFNFGKVTFMSTRMNDR